MESSLSDSANNENSLEAIDWDAWLEKIRKQCVRAQSALGMQPEKANTRVDPHAAHQVLEYWKVPLRSRELLKRTIKATKCLKHVRSWDDRRHWCLALSADKGAGKSTAAASWLLEKARRVDPRPGMKQRWWCSASIARVSGFDETLDDLATVPALVIDDLGLEFSDVKGNFLSRFDELLNHRYANKRPTLLTTNLGTKDFKDRFGERIADRLREDALFIEVDAKSLRGQ